MMSLSDQHNHKILGMLRSTPSLPNSVDLDSAAAGEAGYTLVALLALMTLVAMFAMAAAPSILQQTQREKEKEAIFRGEEVVDAIAQYHRGRGGRGEASLPTSMEQLLEGLPSGTKKRQVLRPSAARDPLSTSGEWLLVSSRSQRMIDFAQAYAAYIGNVPDPRTANRLLPNVAPPILTGIINSGSQGSGLSGTDDLDSTGPFVGVASRSKHDSVITYYGIARHDQWVFTPLFR